MGQKEKKARTVSESACTVPLTPLKIRGNSMAPAITPGATVWGEPAAQRSLVPGDIITYLDAANRLVTHRIVRVLNEAPVPRLEVSGDNAATSETVNRQSVAYRINKIENRVFSYRPDGRLGQWIARQVAHRRPSWRAVQKLVALVSQRKAPAGDTAEP